MGQGMLVVAMIGLGGGEQVPVGGDLSFSLNKASAKMYGHVTDNIHTKILIQPRLLSLLYNY